MERQYPGDYGNPFHQGGYNPGHGIIMDTEDIIQAMVIIMVMEDIIQDMDIITVKGDIIQIMAIIMYHR